MRTGSCPRLNKGGLASPVVHCGTDHSELRIHTLAKNWRRNRVVSTMLLQFSCVRPCCSLEPKAIFHLRGTTCRANAICAITSGSAKRMNPYMI